MRAGKIRHPITMFVVTVLAVIGLGVGLLAATTNQPVYGPSWGHFSAAFPGPICPSPSPVRARSTFFYESASSLMFKCASGWTGYAPLAYPLHLESVDVYGRTVSRLGMKGLVRLTLRVMFHAGATIDVRSANGFSVTTLGPQCSGGSCTEVEYVSKGQILWTLEAVSPGPASTLDGFLDSFHPIA